MQGLNHKLSFSVRTVLRSTMVLGVALGVLQSTPAHAFGPGNDYCVKHNFRIETPGNVAPEVRLKYKCKTFARTNSCKDRSNISGTSTVGAGVTSFFTSAFAPSSWADAESLADVTTLQAGLVAGTIEVNGNADPSVDGCPPPANGGYGYSKASSTAKLSARGRKLDRRGRIKYSGSWKNTPQISGSAEGRRGVVRDPIVARLYDLTDGTVQEWTLMSLMASSDAGEIKWDAGVLGNTASNMSFDLIIDSPVTVQQGRLKIEVEQGIVTELVALGLFSTAPITVGGSGTFSFSLPELTLDFDLGGDETHDLVPEFDFDNGGESEKEAAAICADGSVTTDLGTGYDDSDISQPLDDDLTPGVFTRAGMMHFAEDFQITIPTELVAMSLTSYVPMTPPDMEAFGPSFVRIWSGAPWAGGLPIAINPSALTTSDSTETYRVGDDLHDASNLIRYVNIDLSWAPELPLGQYWVEIGLRANGNQTAAFVVPSVWRSEMDNAMIYNQQQNQWMQARDNGSQRNLGLPLRMYGSPIPNPCPADINGDGFVNVNDLLAVINSWGQNGGPADVNQDGIVNVNDLLAVINAWGQCQSGLTSTFNDGRAVITDTGDESLISQR